MPPPKGKFFSKKTLGGVWKRKEERMSHRPHKPPLNTLRLEKEGGTEW